MSESPSASAEGGTGAPDTGDSSNNKPPTVAAFSPTSHSFPSTRQRSTILVHQKSPLLLATPPQVTRALAYSHPFIVPLNKLVGLLSWTTGDAWESFLLVAAFWLTVLYGDYMLRYAGPVILVTFFIVGMYLRRYSPLSSTGWTGEKAKGHTRDPSDTQIKHRKSLDEILSTLQTCTTRCNILLDPLLCLTDFLSTQQTATSATTQPALTTLFVRIMLATPLWWALTLPPLRIVTTKRMVLVFGTIVLSWHSRPARISRTILWRSLTVRKICSAITGLEFGPPPKAPPPLPPRPGARGARSFSAKRQGDSEQGIRFTFTLYENQRRWLGIGWTSSMLAYERNCWTDEHLNATSDPQHFELPEVEGGMARWRWVDDSEWHVEPPSTKSAAKPIDNDDAWIYYDNKWRDGRRGRDGWGRYTRRRKWIRDAELIDVVPAETPPTPAPEPTATPLPVPTQTSNLTKSLNEEASTGAPSGVGSSAISPSAASHTTNALSPSTADSEVSSPSSSYRRKSWFAREKGSRERGSSNVSASASTETRMSRAAASGDDVVPPITRLKQAEADWGLGEDVSMGMG